MNSVFHGQHNTSHQIVQCTAPQACDGNINGNRRFQAPALVVHGSGSHRSPFGRNKNGVAAAVVVVGENTPGMDTKMNKNTSEGGNGNTSTKCVVVVRRRGQPCFTNKSNQAIIHSSPSPPPFKCAAKSFQCAGGDDTSGYTTRVEKTYDDDRCAQSVDGIDHRPIYRFETMDKNGDCDDKTDRFNGTAVNATFSEQQQQPGQQQPGQQQPNARAAPNDIIDLQRLGIGSCVSSNAIGCYQNKRPNEKCQPGEPGPVIDGFTKKPFTCERTFGIWQPSATLLYDGAIKNESYRLPAPSVTCQGDNASCTKGAESQCCTDTFGLVPADHASDGSAVQTYCSQPTSKCYPCDSAYGSVPVVVGSPVRVGDTDMSLYLCTPKDTYYFYKTVRVESSQTNDYVFHTTVVILPESCSNGSDDRAECDNRAGKPVECYPSVQQGPVSFSNNERNRTISHDYIVCNGQKIFVEGSIPGGNGVGCTASQTRSISLSFNQLSRFGTVYVSSTRRCLFGGVLGDVTVRYEGK